MTIELRPARSTDAGAIAEILWRFQQDTEWMPKLHSGAEYVAFCGAMIDCGWVTVACVEGQVQGFLARDGAEICALYVAPWATRARIGARLLDFAKARATRLTLRVFEANARAQRFYLRNGFVEDGRGDGADVEENLPYISFVWTREERK